MYDIIIVGGGPAGLTAALYSLRGGKSVLVIEKGTFGGQITFSPKVENIPGFNEISGNEFAEKLVDQVINQGGEFENAEVTEIKDGPIKTVIADGNEYEAKAVIIATGAKHRLLGLDKEEDFVGNGISFCAVCDGAFYEGKTVAVIGGGNSALVEAVLLANLVKKLYVVQNLDFLTAEKKLVDQITSRDNVEIILGTVVNKYIEKDGDFAGIEIKKEKTGELSTISLDGLFLAVGLIPQNDAFTNVVNLDERGYANVNESCTCEKKGVFVAGDCRQKRIRQVTTAAADGAIAALAACDYIDKM